MNSAEILRAAKARIAAPEKWFKGDVYGPNGEMCALGAIGDHFIPSALYGALPVGWDSVARYNDHPDTTHADIMALFDRAIALAEAGEQ